jgi:hypothetical protein
MSEIFYSSSAGEYRNYYPHLKSLCKFIDFTQGLQIITLLIELNLVLGKLHIGKSVFESLCSEDNLFLKRKHPSKSHQLIDKISKSNLGGYAKMDRNK